MAQWKGKGRLQLAVRILCAIALLSIGFAHRLPALAAKAYTAAEISAYTLPDGTLPELCLTGHEDGGKAHAQAPKCEACRISGHILVPSPSDSAGTRIAFLCKLDAPETVEASCRKLFSPNITPRGPPAVA